MEYPAGDVELLDDDDDAGPEQAAAAHESYATLVERVTDTRPEEGDLEGLGAYDMAATIAFDLDDKQELLELRSETDRLLRLDVAVRVGARALRARRARRGAREDQRQGASLATFDFSGQRGERAPAGVPFY